MSGRWKKLLRGKRYVWLWLIPILLYYYPFAIFLADRADLGLGREKEFLGVTIHVGAQWYEVPAIKMPINRRLIHGSASPEKTVSYARFDWISPYNDEIAFISFSSREDIDAYLNVSSTQTKVGGVDAILIPPDVNTAPFILAVIPKHSLVVTATSTLFLASIKSIENINAREISREIGDTHHSNR